MTGQGRQTSGENRSGKPSRWTHAPPPPRPPDDLLRHVQQRHGYPQGVKERIFGEFFSYDEEAGTGRGLYIVKMVERYGER
ncbi:MAG: hypothetical protein PHZ19_04765 [Candidatus Thermoplasmatota archaeon]|nr:hypothetical protein [Candidatus Thermoplasmatota archaeon]